MNVIINIRYDINVFYYTKTIVIINNNWCYHRKQGLLSSFDFMFHYLLIMYDIVLTLPLKIYKTKITLLFI